jgi:hypothetical protein
MTATIDFLATTQEPLLEARPAQPYVGMRVRVTSERLGRAIDTGWPEVFGWLADQGVVPAGAPFVRYLVADGATGPKRAELEVELGVPVDTVDTGGNGGNGIDRGIDAGIGGDIEADLVGHDRLTAGVLPAGWYVTHRHVGPFDGLAAAHEVLQWWAREQGLVLDARRTGRGEVWGCRAEHYLVDPGDEPDPARWEVELSYLVAAGTT